MDSTADQVVQNILTLVSTWGLRMTGAEHSRSSFSADSDVEWLASPCAAPWKAEA